jgi:arylsulfatase
MKYAGLYHLNAYTYGDPTWFPDMSPELRAMFQRVTKGALSGNAGEAPHEDFKINGQYVNTPAQGVLGIPFFDDYVEKASLDYLDRAARAGAPFFMSINFMKVHQPNLPQPDYIGSSMSKSKFADSVVELDSRVGRIVDKVRALGLDNGAWQDVYPDAGYTVPRHQGNGAGGRQSRPCDRLDAGQDRGREEDLPPMIKRKKRAITPGRTPS